MAKKDEANLLDEMQGENAAEQEQRTGDLLDEIDETSARVWRPDLNSGADDDHPTGLQGRVVAVGEGPYGYENAVIPWVEIETTTKGEGFEPGEAWLIRGYGNVLIQEIERADPRRGMIFAAKYFGRKEGRSKDGKPGRKFHHYKARAMWPEGQEPEAVKAGSTKSPF